MVYLSLALSLLLAAPTAFAAEKSDGRASTTVPGAFIVEFDELAVSILWNPRFFLNSYTFLRYLERESISRASRARI